MKEKGNSASLPSHVMDTNSQKTKRVYRVWKGSNRFLFGGRLIFGPDVKSMIITVFLIVIPVLLFTCFVSHRLIHEFKHRLGNLIIIIAAVFAAYNIIVLFLTSGRDPGIIPRSTRPPEPEHDSVGSSNLSADWGTQAGHPSLPAFKEILVNGVAVKIKYCQTCMLYRPPRCSHCSICNNCIERFDHHCPWVGQCIGKRNYRFFFMFVSSTTMLCLYVFAFCWVNLIKIMSAYHCNLWKAISMSPVSAILIIYTFIAAWFVGGLTAFHTYLVCTNQTTYENFRYRYDGKMKNPYNRGCFLNIKEIFFSSIPKSKNNFRAKVKEDIPTLVSSLSFNTPTSRDMQKSSVDLEDNGKRHAVVEEEFDDIQSQMGSMSGIERCGTQKGSWGELLLSSRYRKSMSTTSLFSINSAFSNATIITSERSSSRSEEVRNGDKHRKTVRGEKIMENRLGRRKALISGSSLSAGLIMGFAGEGLAAIKQGLLAGRIPGLSEPDQNGWRTYRRPDEKSGGHGVGWSPIIPYTFRVPEGWEEIPVSIADLGGTEIDLRFANAKEGRLFVIVAPVLRFADNLGDNAKIEEIGTPEKVINAFGPEVIGENVEGKVLSMKEEEYDGRKYYQFELEPPHIFISATAAGNRFYLFGVTANGLQWKRHYKELKQIADSFRVV